MKPDQFCSHVRTFQARLSRTYPCLFPCRACRCTDVRVCEWSTPTLLTKWNPPHHCHWKWRGLRRVSRMVSTLAPSIFAVLCKIIFIVP